MSESGRRALGNKANKQHRYPNPVKNKQKKNKPANRTARFKIQNIQHFLLKTWCILLPSKKAIHIKHSDNNPSKQSEESSLHSKEPCRHSSFRNLAHRSTCVPVLQEPAKSFGVTQFATWHLPMLDMILKGLSI